MLKELKETLGKELKKTKKMYQKIKSTNGKIEIIKKNQIENLELKSTITNKRVFQKHI